MTIQINSSGIIWTISSANWPLHLGSGQGCKWIGNHTYCSPKNNWVMESKTVFKICEGIWCSSFYVKEFDVIVHKNISVYNAIHFLAILYPTSLANLVVDVGTWHSHQILLISVFDARNPRKICIYCQTVTKYIVRCEPPVQCINWHSYEWMYAYSEHRVSPQPPYPVPHSWQEYPYDPNGPCHGWLLAD